MGALGKRIINVDLFTDAYRVSGRTLVRSSGLLSELNDPNTDFLHLEDAFVSRIQEPGIILGGYSEAPFRKENISFLVLQDRREGMKVETLQRQSVVFQGQPQQIFLTVPSFEICGDVMVVGGRAPTAILVNSPGRFQLIFDAQACAAQYPDILYHGDLILVRKERIGFFSLASYKS